MLGKFETTLESKTKIAVATLHVAKGDYGCLLSYNAASALGVVTVNVQAIALRPPNHEALLKEYDTIFNGIGQMKDFKVKLHIDNTVTPVAQPARKIPFHMRQKVTAALEKLESKGIIEKVDGPTP